MHWLVGEEGESRRFERKRMERQEHLSSNHGGYHHDRHYNHYLFSLFLFLSFLLVFLPFPCLIHLFWRSPVLSFCCIWLTALLLLYDPFSSHDQCNYTTPSPSVADVQQRKNVQNTKFSSNDPLLLWSMILWLAFNHFCFLCLLIKFLVYQ